MGSRVLVLPALEELKELLRPPLLKETHERALQRLHLVTGNLGDLAIAVDERAGDLLELEIAGDISVDEDLGELARRDDELRDQVDGVVAVASQLSRRILVWPELAVQLSWTRASARCSWWMLRDGTYLSQVQTGTVTAVVVVAIHVEDLLALDGEQPRQDTLGEASAEDNDLRGAR